MDSTEADHEMLEGQANICRILFEFADSMALKCAVELHIADIIHSQGEPLSLSKIASLLNSPSPDIPCLERIMRLLVRRKVFTIHHPSDGGDPLYGLSHSSKWLLHDSELNLGPMVLLENHPLSLAPWHCFSQCVKEGGIAFEKAHRCDIWDLASQNPEFNKLVNDGMACAARMVSNAILGDYKDGFGSIGSLVDVGGGTGGVVAEIVKAYPHIKGINFDLSHVIATAPLRNGVTHIAGDMFEAIPTADAAFLKWVMHDWDDNDCIRILKNCRKAIPEKIGRVIIVDFVLQPEGNGLFDDIGLVFDLLMIAHTSGGKERTEPEWKVLLEKSGFSRFKILKIPALPSVIEAYPE